VSTQSFATTTCWRYVRKANTDGAIACVACLLRKSSRSFAKTGSGQLKRTENNHIHLISNQNDVMRFGFVCVTQKRFSAVKAFHQELAAELRRMRVPPEYQFEGEREKPPAFCFLVGYVSS
jgi:hypothetical protein